MDTVLMKQEKQNSGLISTVTAIMLTLFFVSGHSQTYTSVPNWVNKHSIKDVGEIDAKNIKEGYYYVLVDEQYHRIHESDYFHYATKVVSTMGLEHVSQIEIDFDPSYQAVQIHYVRIHRNGKIIDRTNSSDIKLLVEESQRGKGVINGENSLYANLSDVRVDDVVDFAYSIVGRNSIFNNYFNYKFRFGYSVPVGRITRSIVVEANTKLLYVSKNATIKPSVSTTKYTTYNWIVNNSAIVSEESGTPSNYDPYPYIDVSNSKDWAEVKKWNKSLFKINEYDQSKIITLVDSIKSQHTNLENQITALVDFTQNNIRYLSSSGGIHSHKPHLPDYVMDKRYGDCKDKSLFLVELLKHIGVKSYPVLLHTSKRKINNFDNPSIYEFNHCILGIDYENKIHFVDPTIGFQGGDFKNKKVPYYGAVFLVDDKQAGFSEIPVDTLCNIVITEEIDVNEETKEAILKVHSVYTGYEADEVRYTFANSSMSEMEENYRVYYEKFNDSVELVDSLKYMDDIKANKVETFEHYLMVDYWTKTDTIDVQILKDYMPSLLNDKVSYAEDNDREQPFAIIYPANIKQNVLVTISNGWDMDANLIKEDNKFFRYTYQTSVKKNTLHLNYHFRTKVSQVGAKDYEEYKSKVNFVDNNMVNSVGSSTDDFEVFGFNWLLLLTFTVSAVISFFLCLQLFQKQFAAEYEKKYDSIRGWLILVGIGVVLTPVLLIVEVVQLYAEDINIDYYYYYFNELSPYFNPLQGYFEMFVNFGNMLLLISSVFLIVIFLQKKRSFRYFYIGYRLFNITYLILDIVLLYALVESPMNSENEIVVKSLTAELVKMVVHSAIWIPYIWISHRSQHTFVN